MQILVLLHSKTDLDAYDKDPYHVKVKESFILPNLDKSADKPVMALDWEVENTVYITSSWLHFTAILNFFLFEGFPSHSSTGLVIKVS